MSTAEEELKILGAQEEGLTLIRALLRERAGYEARLAAAQEELEAGIDNYDRKVWQERIVEESLEGIRNVNKSLKYEGWQAAPPAKRAEKRPAEPHEKRAPDQ